MGSLTNGSGVGTRLGKGKGYNRVTAVNAVILACVDNAVRTKDDS